jgi:hypothetical protein
MPYLLVQRSLTPPAIHIVRANCWAEGFEPLDPMGRPLHVPWDQVMAVSAGLVLREETDSPPIPPSTSAPSSATCCRLCRTPS